MLFVCSFLSNGCSNSREIFHPRIVERTKVNTCSSVTVFYKPLKISVEGNKNLIFHCVRIPLSCPTLRLSTVVCFPPEFVSTCLINHAIQWCQHCTDITAFRRPCVRVPEIRCRTKARLQVSRTC
jgi:hypothetical protein